LVSFLSLVSSFLSGWLFVFDTQDLVVIPVTVAKVNLENIVDLPNAHV
jgi:hypothetical protein